MFHHCLGGWGFNNYPLYEILHECREHDISQSDPTHLCQMLRIALHIGDVPTGLFESKLEGTASILRLYPVHGRIGGKPPPQCSVPEHRLPRRSPSLEPLYAHSHLEGVEELHQQAVVLIRQLNRDFLQPDVKMEAWSVADSQRSGGAVPGQSGLTADWLNDGFYGRYYPYHGAGCHGVLLGNSFTTLQQNSVLKQIISA